MNECKDKLGITGIYFINASDIKTANPKDGIVLKRKYGKFDRKIFKQTL